MWCPGPGPVEGQQDRLQGWLDALPGRTYCDIAIRPFQIEVDGIVFGLVPDRCAQDDSEPAAAEFYPGMLGFRAPWNGEYDT